MTNTIRDEIRKRYRLARMRQGQEAPELVDIPSMDGIRVAMVPLSEGESQQSMLAAADLEVRDNPAGWQFRNRAALEQDVWRACREPANPEQLIWESPQVMCDELDPSDVDYLAMRLTALMDYASPSLASLTEEQIDALKKALQKIEWRELTGTRAAAARVFLSHLFPELLAASLSGFTSTEPSTEKTEKGAST